MLFNENDVLILSDAKLKMNTTDAAHRDHALDHPLLLATQQQCAHNEERQDPLRALQSLGAGTLSANRSSS